MEAVVRNVWDIDDLLQSCFPIWFEWRVEEFDKRLNHNRKVFFLIISATFHLKSKFKVSPESSGKIPEQETRIELIWHLWMGKSVSQTYWCRVQRKCWINLCYGVLKYLQNKSLFFKKKNWKFWYVRPRVQEGFLHKVWITALRDIYTYKCRENELHNGKPGNEFLEKLQMFTINIG